MCYADIVTGAVFEARDIVRLNVLPDNASMFHAIGQGAFSDPARWDIYKAKAGTVLYVYKGLYFTDNSKPVPAKAIVCIGTNKWVCSGLFFVPTPYTMGEYYG